MARLFRYIGHRLYTTWATFWFVLPFVLTYPVQWALSKWPAGHRYLHALNRGWSHFFILMWGMPVETIGRANVLPAGRPAVYVANHSSLIDIPLLFRTLPGWLNVLGKSSLAKVPLWGPIFGRAYLTVDRNSAVSRGRALVLARRVLAEGRAVIIFPEGQISRQAGRELEEFKDGAFQLAIAAGVPIVPITMPLNHRFLPDVGGLRVRYSPLAIIVHAPIATTGLTAADAPALRRQAQATIASALRPEAGGLPEASTWRATPPSPPEPAPHPASRQKSPA
ncbi:lysophospholipid acyltransferase family protein [Hymenobacter rubripertinctus]|uniref:1-acyl-sn-glycerol-3-phosphate acyltransferase n=1 Tax=Hymenobacter rubripertinctus TaxID=2029981 RepID=A0A418QU59_9BACT|nr:lysophospholipid acyltransferase family protein [Hymenobacter rubripertinctus]RIY08742.1 1-acyl-sn-glycerol-3-phosphate acyltransferase [Hymenobacter rubripertinctus]